MTDTLRPLTAYRVVGTVHGDTLQRVAARALGSAARWPAIAAINGLVWPYFTDDVSQAGNGVVLYGTSLKVPSATSNVPDSISASDPLGTDLQLTDGQIADNGAGDFAAISGNDNYQQAARHAVETDRQELLWHLRYGSLLRKVVGRVNGATAAALAKGYAVGALLADRRTLSVPKITVDVSGSAVSITAQAVTVNGTSVDVQANP